MKIYLDGKDNVGWSMDIERKNIQNALQRLHLKEVRFWGSANIVHNIWWNRILHPKFFFIRQKKNILVTTSNFINLNDDEYSLRNEFEKVTKIAKAWVVPSTKQKKIFDAYGILSHYQPFYLNFNLFKPSQFDQNKKIIKKYLIPQSIISDKIIIASFQRDSLGTNLSSPKWQKGPDILIDILKTMPKDKFILLLAGPRRHYVINECRKFNIPYYYMGKETNTDDALINSININDMPELYSFIDIYMVTSKSEGGPKAIMEATAMKKFILSTDVGIASDFLEPDNVFSSISDYKKKLFDILTGYDSNSIQSMMKMNIDKQYSKCLELLSFNAMDKRLLNIYQSILNDN